METNVSSGNFDDANKNEAETLSKTEALVQADAIVTDQILGDIRILIETRKSQVALVVNTQLVLLNWHIGKRIRSEIIGEGRAEYGEQVVKALSKALTQEYGRGFSSKSLFHMIRFAEAFPDEEIVSTLSRQLTWSHFLEIVYLRWLDKNERKAWEESPIGLILCSEKDQEQIELLQMTQGEIRVAEYLTELPPQPILQAKLREAIRVAREQVERKW